MGWQCCTGDNWYATLDAPNGPLPTKRPRDHQGRFEQVLQSMLLHQDELGHFGIFHVARGICDVEPCEVDAARLVRGVPSC